MTLTTTMRLGAAASLLIGVTTVRADYHTNPELKPSSRCGMALQKNPLPNPGNIDSLETYTTDCQPLYWDLPATVQLHVPVRAAYDSITGFLHGLTDRPPPLYTDGVDGFDEPGFGLTQLCPDVVDPVTGGIDHLIPWWALAGQGTGGTKLSTGPCPRGGPRPPRAPAGGGRTPNSPNSGYTQQSRNATQSPGRLFVDLPTGRAVYNLEDQLWACDHHVVSELPIGYQGNTTFRNFRNQKGGLIAQHAEDGWPAPGTTPIGGGGGGVIIQLFTAPGTDGSYKPISVGFDVVVNVGTTFFPPYTLGDTRSVRYAPHDL